MTQEADTLARAQAELAEVNRLPWPRRLSVYARRSGPGWLQGAITLGGASLSSALYLGVVSGYHLMWLQPLAMLCGVIMLAAIAYVTLSTGERPFGLINRLLSPALGWAWLLAAIMGNIVWCMPQFTLGLAAVQQNFGVEESLPSTLIICGLFLAIALCVNWLYQSKATGGRIFDLVLKLMVAIIVISFFLVVIVLARNGMIPFAEIAGGFVPNFSYLFQPAADYLGLIESSSDPDYWTQRIAASQRDIILAAFASAVGINMTFLLPYSMLRKGWGREHRPLAIFDLSIGLFVPFFLATSCVVIAVASQFHGKTDDIFDEVGKPLPAMEKAYLRNLAEVKNPNDGDRQLAAMLVRRDSFQLANTLEPLAGKIISQVVFGIGVLGMALSTIIIVMLINGLAFQELLGKPDSRRVYMLGCLVSGVAGFFGPFIWKEGAKMALAVPTSVIGGALIPIAYLTFLLLMNSKKVLGDARPQGITRLICNLLMVSATAVATFGSVWGMVKRAGTLTLPGVASSIGLVGLVLLAIVGIAGFIRNERSDRA